MNLESLYGHLPVPAQNVACSLNGWQIRRRRYGPAYRDVAASYQGRQTLGAAELRALQTERLSRHLLSAAETPFWARRFRELGLDPASDHPWTVYGRLPVLTKGEVQAHRADILRSAAGEGLVSKHTSGTTGAGLIFAETRLAEREQWAVWWRYRHAHGIRLDDWCGYFGGRSVVPLRQTKPPYWRLNYPGRQILFSAYHLSAETVSSYVAALEAKRPAWLHGYPSTLALLAALVRDRHPRFENPVRIVTTGAESLLDHQRRLIEDVFGCTVRQHYGLSEGTANVSECPMGMLHVDEDFAYLELLPLAPGSRECRILGSNWSNPAFPLLRYDTGDTGTLSETGCGCGWTGRVLEKIDGRVEDYVVLANGARVGRLDHIFKDMVDVREAQVRQDEPGAITLRIVRGPAFTTATADELIRETKKRLGDDMRIAIEYCEHIERTTAGKLRFVVSSTGRLDAVATGP